MADEVVNKYDSDLLAIADQLNHRFLNPDPALDVDLDYLAFEELKRLAGLQTTRLHSGQSIKRQIDSMIKSWRRTIRHGGATPVQAAHYLDCLQQVRVAIFGEPLPEEDGSDELIIPDIEEQFKKFVTDNQVDKKDLAAARKGFEAAFGDDIVLALDKEVLSVNGVLYKPLTEAEVKKYGFK